MDCEPFFEIFNHHEKKRRRVNKHNDVMDKIRAIRGTNKTAISFLDQYRGESSLAIPMLAGTLPTGSFEQQWACCAFTIGPNEGSEWIEWETGSVFEQWKKFLEKTDFVPSDIMLESDAFETWRDAKKKKATKAKPGALQIGLFAGGEGIWVVPDGSVWIANHEPGEVPFIKLFEDLGDTVGAVVDAHQSGELFEKDGIWCWGEATFEDGDDEWRPA